MRFLNPQELQMLAGACDGYATLIYAAGYLGLRWGELAGLKRARVNLLRQVVEVVEILTEVKGRLDFGLPKTKASRRSVSIPGFLNEMLSEHLEKQTGRPGHAGVRREGRGAPPPKQLPQATLVAGLEDLRLAGESKTDRDA